ncbi:hypothetical protein EXIGLDRAFT_40065 [Exidia glandulosa HHB12029]|uniref:Uncharacterized protein n=1 Tax=Exidia glandulosa HHB12029 TaxID=1314781 RepID=A0A165INV4_EXIGL|nr:hypothetical protein EXIGLDRAFT_40065 [Exidia glandulosa HHB12029]
MRYVHLISRSGSVSVWAMERRVDIPGRRRSLPCARIPRIRTERIAVAGVGFGLASRIGMKFSAGLSLAPSRIGLRQPPRVDWTVGLVARPCVASCDSYELTSMRRIRQCACGRRTSC